MFFFKYLLMSMHLIYYRDDPELDGMLKDRLRWGDPMAHLVKVLATFLLTNVAEIVIFMFAFS